MSREEGVNTAACANKVHVRVKHRSTQRTCKHKKKMYQMYQKRTSLVSNYASYGKNVIFETPITLSLTLFETNTDKH